MNRLKVTILICALVLAAVVAEGQSPKRRIAPPNAQVSRPSLNEAKQKPSTGQTTSASAGNTKREVCFEKGRYRCYAFLASGIGGTVVRTSRQKTTRWPLDSARATQVANLFDQISSRAAQAGRGLASNCQAVLVIRNKGRSYSVCPGGSAALSRQWLEKWFADLHRLTHEQP